MKQVVQILLIGTLLISINPFFQNAFAETVESANVLNIGYKGSELIVTVPSNRFRVLIDNFYSSSNITKFDTTPCKTFISFTNNFKETLIIKLKTNKKVKDGWGNEIDETIDFNLSSGKTKKIKVDSGDTYKYISYTGDAYFSSIHTQGVVEAEECKTVDEEID